MLNLKRKIDAIVSKPFRLEPLVPGRGRVCSDYTIISTYQEGLTLFKDNYDSHITPWIVKVSRCMIDFVSDESYSAMVTKFETLLHPLDMDVQSMVTTDVDTVANRVRTTMLELCTEMETILSQHEHVSEVVQCLVSEANWIMSNW